MHYLYFHSFKNLPSGGTQSSLTQLLAALSSWQLCNFQLAFFQVVLKALHWPRNCELLTRILIPLKAVICHCDNNGGKVNVWYKNTQLHLASWCCRGRLMTQTAVSIVFLSAASCLCSGGLLTRHWPWSESNADVLSQGNNVYRSLIWGEGCTEK